jgi:hypothetical protein
MSLLILSLLLLLLVGMGLLMGPKQIREMFDNPPPATATVVSPALANLLTGTSGNLTGPLPQTDTLAREQEAVGAANGVSTTPLCPACPACPSCPECPKCPTCKDMSKYIKMDEIPCWNCTLP